MLTVTDKALYQPPVAIEDERLRDVLIIAQILIGELVVRKAERILNAKLSGVTWNEISIFGAADVEADHLQPVLFVLPLKLNQMRRFFAAGRAPGGVEIKHHNFSFVVRKGRALFVA